MNATIKVAIQVEQVLIETKKNAYHRTEIWDTSQPHSIGHPAEWIIQRISSGVEIVNILNKSRNIYIQNQELKAGSLFSIQNLSVRLKWIPPINPAYLSEISKTEKNLSQSLLLLAFSGMKRSILTCQRVHSAYIAYVKRNPVFIVHQNKSGIRIKFLLNGVYSKLKGHPPLSKKSGEIMDIRNDQLTQITVSRGWHWWRFNFISTLSFPIPHEPADKQSKLPHIFFILTFLGFFLFTLALWHEFNKLNQWKEKRIKVLPPIIRFQPSQPQPIQKFSRMERPSLEKISFPKEKLTSLLTQPTAPVHSPAPQLKVLQLKEALKGAMALTSQPLSTVKKEEPATKASAKIFESPSTPYSSTLSRTQISPINIESKTKVQTLGSTANYSYKKGVNYSNADPHTDLNKKNFFVSLNTQESQVEEGLTKEEVGAIIHRYLGEIRYCYDSAMIYQPKIDGRLVINFTIGKKGAVSSAFVQSSMLTEQKLADCILSRLKRWQFPSPRAGIPVTVSYPFQFKTLRNE